MNNPYQAPQAQVGQTTAVSFPTRRFLLSCAGWLLLVPIAAGLVLYLLPTWFFLVPVGLIVLWLPTLTWVIGPYRKASFIRLATVAVGLTISLAICFLLGSAFLLTSAFNNKPIEVTLPQRGI
jgi:hypothetical protein